MATNFRSTHCADLHAVKLRMYHSGTQGDLEEENRQLRLAKQALEASNLAHLARLQAHERTHARTHARTQAGKHAHAQSLPTFSRTRKCVRSKVLSPVDAGLLYSSDVAGVALLPENHLGTHTHALAHTHMPRTSNFAHPALYFVARDLLHSLCMCMCVCV